MTGISGGSRPRLLYISPVFPDVTGNGLAMRAGMFMQALAQTHDVFLLTVPRYPGGGVSSEQLIERCCVAHAFILPLPAAPGPFLRIKAMFYRRPGVYRSMEPLAPRALHAFPGVEFDVVHVFRLSAWAFARPFLDLPADRRPAIHLDLDDIESDTLRAIAGLHRLNGDTAVSEALTREAAAYASLEGEALARCDRVYVCSEADRTRLEALYRLRRTEVVPNAVNIPSLCAPRSRGVPFRFLFLGTLGYSPNQDGANYFCTQVAPLIREQTGEPFVVDVAGSGTPEGLDDLRRLPYVHLAGHVDDVAPSYTAAGAVVIPLRAGGGSRIKALEAFAHRRPVVATSQGIAGIDAVDGTHVLIADTPSEFAAACVRLMQDRQLGDHLAANAFELVQQRYSTEAVRALVNSLATRPR